MVNLSEKIAPVFYPVHKAIRDETHDEFWIKGGRNSLKSSTVALEIVLGIIQDPDANAVCFRKVGNFIKDSIQATILWAIDELDETDNFYSINSPHEITYKPTGQKILLRGLDKPTKIKSIKLRKGYFKYLWFEEADEYSGDEEIRSVEQSVLRGDHTQKFVEFLTYNPPKNKNHWINRLVEQDVGDKFIHHSTYLDIPQEWISQKAMKKINRMKENNYETYAHEYLGKCIGNPEEIVFSGQYEVRDFETPSLDLLYQNRFFFGADWGFANDPTVLIRSFIQDDCLWIDYECYKLHVEIDHIGKVVFDKVPESRKWRIEGDSSAPATISNVRRQGFNIRGAPKWKGCVDEGIKFMKNFKKIIIHSRCVNILKEFEVFSYKIDKETKEVLPIIDDKKTRLYKEGDKMGIKDDGIDCVRGSLVTYIKPGATTMGFNI
jgi:phage terminase large subunit